jgi:hypothetical protein
MFRSSLPLNHVRLIIAVVLVVVVVVDFLLNLMRCLFVRLVILDELDPEIKFNKN